MNWTAITLGGLAGVTIFLGLPIAFLKNLNPRVSGFLTAMSTGILVFLLVEITGKVIDNVEGLTVSAASGFVPPQTPSRPKRPRKSLRPGPANAR